MKRIAFIFILILSYISVKLTGQISSASISGNFNVSSVLTASYGDSPESGNHVDYTWFYAPATSLGTGSTYTIQSADQGRNIFVTATENVDVTHVFVRSFSSGQTIVNSYPLATYVSISGVPRSGMTLNGSYLFSDADGDSDGSTFRWYKGNTPGGDSPVLLSSTAKSITLTDAELTKYIGFYVTPASTTGSTPGSEVATSVWIGPVTVNNAPVASALSISGTLKVGSPVTAIYTYTDAEGDVEGSSTIEWFRDANGTGVSWESIAGPSTTRTYTLTNSEYNKLIKFEVKPVAATGSNSTTVYASSNSIQIINPAPTATIQAITGTGNAGEALTGHYIYSDGEGDLETGSVYQWSASSTSGGTFNPVSGGITHIIEMSEQGYYFKFEVTPQTLTGDPVGSPVISAEYGPANTKPYATGVTINYPNLNVGTELTGSYVFNDIDGDLVGTSIFKWFRGGAQITDATDIKYTLVAADEGYKITFEVTPVSITGYPDTGTPVMSAETEKVDNPGDPGPVASEVCIQGKNALNEVLTGHYLYTYTPKREGNSVYQWYRNGSPISPNGAGLHYTMTSDDIGKDITFGVIPKSVSPVKTGLTEAKSYPLVKITIPQASYSVAIDSVLLTASINGGVFSGPGVTNRIFSPSAVGVSATPYRIEYYHDTVFNNYTSCSQQAIKDITVVPNDVQFSSGKPVYCKDDVPFTLTVVSIPSGAIPYTPYGFFINSPGNKVGIVAGSEQLVSTPWSVVIDPSKLRVGTNLDRLYLYYYYGGYYYLIERAFTVESVGTVSRIANLNSAYCTDDLAQAISIEGLYPVKGKAIWSAENILLPGDYIMNQADTALTSSVVTPTLGTAGQTYRVKYQYKSINGCYSNIISKDVLINPLPDAAFALNPTYNVDGDPVILKDPLPEGGSFSGNGVLGNMLFPDLAGPGNDIITYEITDPLTKCYNSLPHTTFLRKAQGDFGDLPSVICYRDTTYSIQIKSITGIISNDLIKNTKKTIIYTPGSLKADYKVTEAGAGSDTIVFSYTWDSDDYSITKIINIDSLGQVAIKSLLPGDGVCNNVEPFELFTTHIGGIFTGPVTAGYLDPSKAIGPISVSYKYTNQKTGCYTKTIVPITIFPAPDVSFLPKDVCIENSTDSTFFTNSTTSSDPVQSWLWEFSESGISSFSTLKEPGNLFKTGGYHLVSLKATTSNNCSVTKSISLDLGMKPIADFYWENECFKANENLLLFDNTSSFSPIVSRTWKFFDGDSLRTVKNPEYPKRAVGFLPVEYIVKTKYAGCNDTIYKEILIRPTINLAIDNYFEDFETGNGDWIKDAQSRNSWTFGTPDRNNISYAASGNNAWYTKFNLTNQKVESSSVESPCFDFTGIERPMINLKLWKRFDTNRDGAAIQYKIGDTGGWEYLGTLNDGINWFNSTLIKGRPGGEQIGWTTGNTPDSTWISASHKLDILKGKKNVKLRISYGSDGTSQENEGIAFDDIWIGERTRNVLLEHFTNASSIAGRNSNTIVNSSVVKAQNDVINIQYHTNFPGSDLFYTDSPDDASARTLYYGLSITPYSVLDGGTGVTKNNFANVFDYQPVPDLDTNDINRRSLIDPSFEIDLTTEVNGGVLSVKTGIKALENLNEENLTLYLAVTAKEIRLDNATPNGEKTFRNVFRKMLPDAGGSDLKKVWATGESINVGEKTWTIEKVYNASDISVVAYIQNNVTKEIYQAEMKSQNIGVVGVDDIFGRTGTKFSIYPNPTTDHVTIAFDRMPGSGTNIWIYDYTGSILKMFKTGNDQMEYTIDDLNLTNGLYMIKVFSESIDFGFRKLVISGK